MFPYTTPYAYPLFVPTFTALQRLHTGQTLTVSYEGLDGFGTANYNMGTNTFTWDTPTYTPGTTPMPSLSYVYDVKSLRQ